MFRSYVCHCCGGMFTHPDCFELPRVDGEPAHVHCKFKHEAKKQMVDTRIEYLISLQPKTEEESLAVHAELFQLMGRTVP